jgi:penicillin-binding protein 2
MLIIDQLKRNDPQLRAVSGIILYGLGILLAGLWWVQVVSARDYQANLELQSFRTVRIPAVRGKILDRTGQDVFAESRPAYQVSLYLEELRRPVDSAYFDAVARARRELAARLASREQQLGRRLTRDERRSFLLGPKEKLALKQAARTEVASNAVLQVSQRLGQAIPFDTAAFERHCYGRLALPFPVLSNLSAEQIAHFEEQSIGAMGVDLDVQSVRVYPGETLAAHVLGCLRRDDSSAEGEEAYFSYRLPDFRGLLGIEAGYDQLLRGRAGAKSVLVNNVGYRQTESIWSQAEPGRNVVLTLDAHVQRAAERALQVFGPVTRGAAIVMDVNSGDILALASSPTLNPNHFVQGLPPGERQRLFDPRLRPQINRATQENYAPGSIFKTLIALVCLENGLDETATIYNPGYIMIGRRRINDLAPAGTYDFLRALKLSSNTYFITNGMKAGIESIVRLGHRLHLGERAGLPTRQDVGGVFPSLRRIAADWYDGDTANLCIGQGQIAVTPLQMAVMTSAIANGGTVFWPRLADRIEPPDTDPGEPPLNLPRAQVRDHLGVSRRSLDILRRAMLADVEDADGTGRHAAVPGLRICGKTGTAQVMNERNQLIGHTTWFVSFAPYEHPRYAVVVMIEMDSGGSGGGTCAPVAAKIYSALLERERTSPGNNTLARAN